MQRSVFPFLCLAAIAVPRASRADAIEDAAMAARDELAMVALPLENFVGGELDPKGVERCTGAIAKARAAGVPGTQELASPMFVIHPKHGVRAYGGMETIMLDQASWICDRYRAYVAYARALPVFGKMDVALTRYAAADGVMESQEGSTAPRELGAACAKAWDAAKAAGVPDDLVVRVGAATTFREIRAKVCEALPAKFARSVAANVEARRVIRQRYTSAGLAGDKLELAIRYHGTYWRLSGGARTDDPTRIARASVLFAWFERSAPNDPRYVIHTIRKYRFKGNALIGTTERQYLRRAGMRLSESVFQ